MGNTPDVVYVDKMRAEPIYLDYQATAPLDPRVLDAMLPFLSGQIGNPHSSSHLHGIAAMQAVERARLAVADLISAEAEEIIFTSGATEANNLLLRGAAAAARQPGRVGVVTTAIEHKAVLEVIRQLGEDGFRVNVVGVDSSGIVNLEALSALVDDRTALVSVMAANNEMGVLQPLREIGSICQAAGALCHTDAAQAAGKVPLDVRSSGIELMSLSSHKLYGPMGIGAAFISRKVQRKIAPLLRGGGQERGFRSGTLPVALCVGFGEACRIAQSEMHEEAKRLKSLSSLFLKTLRNRGTGFAINGAVEPRLPGNLNLSFPGIDSEALILSVRDRISIASGSACTAASLDPSHVILALGFGQERAEEAVRIGFGRPTTDAEVAEAALVIAKAVENLGRVTYKPRFEGMSL